MIRKIYQEQINLNLKNKTNGNEKKLNHDSSQGKPAAIFSGGSHAKSARNYH